MEILSHDWEHAMNYLNQEFEAGPDDVVEITLDGQANVMLLDPINYEHYRKREPFKYYGGLAKYTPMQMCLLTRVNGMWSWTWVALPVRSEQECYFYVVPRLRGDLGGTQSI